MYHCKLKVSIISRSFFIEQQLSRIRPLERFEHIFTTKEVFTGDELENSHIILADGPENMPARPEGSRMKGLLILCADRAAVGRIDDYMLEQADDLWIGPLNEQTAKAYFRRHLEYWKLRKDMELYQNYLETAMNSIPDLVWFKDAKGSHLKVNDSFCRAVNKTKEQIEGRGHFYIWDIPREEYEQGEYICLESEEEVIRARKTCLFDEKVKTKNGLRQFKTYKSPLFDEDGSVMGTVGVAHDVTDLQNMGNELEIIMRSIPFAVLVCDEKNVIINANEKFEEYFHIDKQAVAGRRYLDWKEEQIENISLNSYSGCEEATVTLDGEVHYLEIHEEPVIDIFHNTAGYLYLYQDVTIEHNYELETLRNANTDFLTGLYNRRYFYEYMTEHRGRQPVALLYMDLDNFKDVNDTYGHQVGDEVLAAVAKKIQHTFPGNLAARIGGDEFLVAVLGACDREWLEKKASELMDVIQEGFDSSRMLKGITASIGIVQNTNPDLTVDELVSQSDQAMYEAKQFGKVRYCFYEPEDGE
ncbi:diguanylate cyclase [Anaerolentibacter hominis]|uniref:sensor domain-containing diguanylate cyclase n=1 Tax=Anaerolentibacter hominis TaxID=3079009 RepID=UPI0031B82396